MKHLKWVMLIALGLLLAVGTVYRCEMPAYAYTEEEKEMAKDWLRANGYSPTMAGAEQAYQDYLNGKWGPVGGEGETPTEVPTEVPTEISTEVLPVAPVETVVETMLVETTTEEMTTTEATTTEEETTETVEATESVTVMMSETEEVLSTADEVSSEETTEAENVSGIRVGVVDVMIAVVAAVACVAMILGTYLYIKKSKKDNE